MKNTYIYSLSDPITNNVRYIGKSDNPEKRYTTHLAEYGGYHKVCWIKSLKKIGLKPKLDIIDCIPDNEWQFWEEHYISLYKSWGFKLTNILAGGNGGYLPGEKNPKLERKHSEETKEKIRQSKIGHKQSEETKLKRSESLKGRVFSIETREKISTASKNKILTKEHKDKISKSMIGNTNKKFGNNIKKHKL
jgi:hypothetical protein